MRHRYHPARPVAPSGRDIDAITINVVSFDNNITKVDTDSQYDGWLRRAFVRRRDVGTLHRKCTAHGIDHATKLGD
jgi:hypothetical protein